MAFRVRSYGSADDVVRNATSVISLEDPDTGEPRELGDAVRDELIALEHAARHTNLPRSYHPRYEPARCVRRSSVGVPRRMCGRDRNRRNLVRAGFRRVRQDAVVARQPRRRSCSQASGGDPGVAESVPLRAGDARRGQRLRACQSIRQPGADRGTAGATALADRTGAVGEAAERPEVRRRGEQAAVPAPDPAQARDRAASITTAWPKLQRAKDPFDAVARVENVWSTGEYAFGDASDLIGNACGVHLAASV